MMVKAVLLAATAAFMSPAAAAQGVHQDWSTFSAEGMCWAAALPVSAGDGIAGRKGPYLSITNQPSKNVRGSVAIIAGFGVGQGEARLSVDGKGFDTLPFGEAAFVASGTPEASLISAMRSGKELAVTWSDGKGNSATDTYSLMGFTAAKAVIDGACR